MAVQNNTMTEEEAKTKWCPMVRAGRIGSNTTASVNWPADGGKSVEEQEWAKCIGSACMMWRTDQRFTVHRDVVPINVRFSDNGEIRSELATPDEPQHGHCGMGGKP